MATLRMLHDTVVLANYIGEVRDVAQYQLTTLSHVYCPETEGAAVSSPGRRENDSAMLYIFDLNSVATDEEGNIREYVDYEIWCQLEDKSGFWTLNDGGRDTFKKSGSQIDHTITRFSHLVAGTKRMWHFEVEGR